MKRLTEVYTDTYTTAWRDMHPGNVQTWRLTGQAKQIVWLLVRDCMRCIWITKLLGLKAHERNAHDIHGIHQRYRKGSCGWTQFCSDCWTFGPSMFWSVSCRESSSPLPRCLDKEIEVMGPVPNQAVLWGDRPLPRRTELERGPGRGTCSWRVNNVPCRLWLMGEGGWEKSNRSLPNCMLRISEFSLNVEDNFDF